MKVAIGHDSHRFLAGAEGAGRAESAGGAVRTDGGAGRADGGDGGNGGDGLARASGAERANRLDRAAKPLLLGGVPFGGAPPLDGNSDADVVLHALCNAISGLTGVNILGGAADRMCLIDGISDSEAYVREALRHMGGARLAHLSFSIECARPKIAPRLEAMRDNIARIAGLPRSSVGITATSGEGLTDFGRGLGIQAFCIATAE